MSETRVHCILDANVIFDLHAGEILNYPCTLPYELLTTDFVLEEIESISLTDLENCGLQVMELPPERVLEIFTLRPRHLALSLADLSVYVYARHFGCMILTGDGVLWTLARESHIDAHGTIWVVDRLVDEGTLTPPEASRALQLMRDWERWLPKAEIEKRIREWSRG
jgi:rRNA-processing protein FCF1